MFEDELPPHLLFGPDLWPFELCEYDIPDMTYQSRTQLIEQNQRFYQTQHAARQVQERLKHELDELMTTDMSLARDLAYFGENERSLQQILDAYHMTPEDLRERLADDEFRLLVKTLRKDMEKDVNGMVRARAKMYLDAEMDLIHEAIMDRTQPLSERIKGFKMMAAIADAIPRNENNKDGGGMTGPAANVTINIGGNSPFAPQLQRVFEGSAERVEVDDG